MINYDAVPEFQSTHPVRGGTLGSILHDKAGWISIHPPREGWDSSSDSGNEPSGRISIHPPREGWDGIVDTGRDRAGYFNPPTP